jgi:hypothetical protein
MPISLGRLVNLFLGTRVAPSEIPNEQVIRGGSPMTDGSWSNPWKLTAIGLAVVVVTALVTEIVVAHRFRTRADQQVAAVSTTPSRAAVAPAPQPAVARTPQPVSSTPPRASIDACHQQAEQASQRDKTMEVVKDGAIGALGGAAVGAAGGAIADGGRGAGKGAAIGGILGAGVGSLYGLNENQKQDQRYRDAYAKCMHARGHTG